MIRNLTKEILKNKVFLILLFVMTVCTSFLFFFIRFSIDANLVWFNGLTSLTQNQQNYLRALHSNSSLALTMLFAVAGVTALMFALFYFRFYRSAKIQIGILKSTGSKNTEFQVFFCVFAVLFSIIGLLFGMLLGYFASSVHIAANTESYGVTGLVKGVNAIGVIVGIGMPALLFGAVMFLCGFSLYGKDNAELIAATGGRYVKQSKLLKFANACVQKLPIRNKASVRIALRRPLSLLIMTFASMIFTVMLVLGWSLTISGDYVFQSQTQGHNYQYESRFNKVRTARTSGNAIYCLKFEGVLVYEGESIEQTLTGTDFNEALYELKNTQGGKLSALTGNDCYIGEELLHMYHIAIGEEIVLKIGEHQIAAKVRDVAYNVGLKTVLLDRKFLAEQLHYNPNGFNGVLSEENLYPDADSVIDKLARQAGLERNKVSSQVSAVINQAIGVLSGIVLIFSALFITFQDSVKDMMILRNLGYRNREIKRMLINIFLPILLIGYAVTAYPAICIAKTVQFSLSLQTGDYMPFSTDIYVVLVGLVAVAALYFAVQAIFSLMLRYTLKRKSILQYTNEL